MMESTCGLQYVDTAVQLSTNHGNALDVGCGSGGRIVAALLDSGFQVTGIDVSEAMIRLARKHHPGTEFIVGDICEWKPDQKYDVVVAWDSTFHVPHDRQRDVTQKLCQCLKDGGVLLFTCGGTNGEMRGEMHGFDFYYSSLDGQEYLGILKDMECQCLLLERDQLPNEHLVVIGTKLNNVS